MPRKTFANASPNAEDKALEVWSDVIIDKLNRLSKDAKWEQPWFDKEGLAWPQNISGRPYSGLNAVVLKMLAEKNHYETPVWLTYNRLTSLNYQKDPTKGPLPLRDSDGNDLPRVMINKGEKSTPVGLTTFTVVNKETKEKIPYEDFRQMEPDEQVQYNVYPKMMIYNVFNLSQTNMKEVRPELYEKLKAQSSQQQLTDREREMYHLPELDAMITEQKWICPVDIKDEGKCFYSISRDRIQMVPPEKFKTGEAFASNFWHEASHSTLKLFNRFDPQKLDDKAYSKEEITAELSAALVASTKGLHKSVKQDSLPYIKSWLDNIREDPRYIKSVLMDVKKASGAIIQHMEDMRVELEQRNNAAEKEDVSHEENISKEAKATADKSAVVAAKAAPSESHESLLSNGRAQEGLDVVRAAPEPPKEEQEEVVRRGFHR